MRKDKKKEILIVFFFLWEINFKNDVFFKNEKKCMFFKIIILNN